MVSLKTESYTPSAQALRDYGKQKLERLNRSNPTSPEYMSAPQLKRLRNWTDSSIKIFLGSPIQKPIGPRNSELPSWSIEEIMNIEQSLEFDEWMQKRLATQYQTELKNGLADFRKNQKELTKWYKKSGLKRHYLKDLILECEMSLCCHPIFKLPPHDLPGYPLDVKRQAEKELIEISEDIESTELLQLHPTVSNPNVWRPERPNQNEWRKIRQVVLERDDNTCQFCGHKASKYMNIHHVAESEDNDPNNLVTCCAACHAVLHTGRNLSLGKIEIWETDIQQVDIVRETRKGIQLGKSLDEIKASFPLAKGKYEPNSVEYANSVLANIGDEPRMELDRNLCAVFVDFERWQIE